MLTAAAERPARAIGRTYDGSPTSIGPSRLLVTSGRADVGAGASLSRTAGNAGVALLHTERLTCNRFRSMTSEKGGTGDKRE